MCNDMGPILQWRSTFRFVGILALAGFHTPAFAQQLAWEHDFRNGVMGFAVAVDSTGVYLAGIINGPNT
jgi:hypothetical protein